MMDVEDAVMYLEESQSIGTGAYGESAPAVVLSSMSVTGRVPSRSAPRSGSVRDATARRRCRRNTEAPSSLWTSGS